jgi:hypothetical protein
LTPSGRSANEEIRAWQAGARLDLFVKQAAVLTGTETEVIEQLGRYGQYAGPAAANLPQLLAN